jgi:hypothetical protein
MRPQLSGLDDFPRIMANDGIDRFVDLRQFDQRQPACCNRKQDDRTEA